MSAPPASRCTPTSASGCRPGPSRSSSTASAGRPPTRAAPTICAPTSGRASPAAASSAAADRGPARQPDVRRDGEQVPFDIQRVFYLYDVPGGEVRGGHAHQQLEQL